MNHRVRLAATLAAVLAAACAGSPAPQILPRATAPPSLSPGLVATPGPSFSTPPPSTCPASYGSSPTSGLELQNRPFLGSGFARPRLLRVVAVGGDAVGSPEPEESQLADFGLVSGGRAMSIEVQVANDPDAPLLLDAAQARYRGGVVGTRIGDRRLEVDMPDGDDSGELRLELAWHDACFTYLGDVRLMVETVALETVTACERETTDMRAYVAAHWPGTIALNGTEVPFGDLSFEGRYGGDNAITDVIWWAGWSADSPVATGGVGGTVSITEHGDEIGLGHGSLSLYDLAAWADEGGGPLAYRRDQPGTDGTGLIDLPDDPGRYVAYFTTGWDMPCAFGTGDAIFTLEIN